MMLLLFLIIIGVMAACIAPDPLSAIQVTWIPLGVAVVSAAIGEYIGKK